MAKTSVHLTACNITSSELHNKRQRSLDYIRKDLSHLNESFNYTGRSLAAELKAVKAEVKAKTGRALQKNAIPIKEGVAVIEQDTTMEQLKDFCERCRAEFGIVPLQIHIHKDEGHAKSKEWKPNLHAHIVWKVYGEDGRNVRTTPKDYARMQTILAETLGMERGESSDKKHKSARQFKAEAQARELDEKVREKKAELAGLSEAKAVKEAAIDAAKEKVQDFFTGKSKAKEKEMKAEIRRLTADLAQKDKDIAEIKERTKNAEKRAENKQSLIITGLQAENAELRMETQKAKIETGIAMSKVAVWQKFGEHFWPGLLDAIKAIIDRCTTTMQHFTGGGIQAIEKAIGRFGEDSRKAAAKDLWKIAEGLMPKNADPDAIRAGKEEYDRLVDGEQQHSQTIKR